MSNIFEGGGGSNFVQGVQMLITIEIHITCDFPGGFQTSDPHMLKV